MRRKRSNKSNKNVSSQAIVPSPRGNLIPSQAKRIERTVLRISGANFTNATGAGYAWYTVNGSVFGGSSPWTALSGLYMFVRPLYARVTVTASRATSSTDMPLVGFAATPDGNAVGTTAMNLSTFEAANCMSRTIGPGQEVAYTFRPYIAVAAYNTPTNGYVPMQCPRVSLNSLPLIYFGDILVLTPGVVLTSSANYLVAKIEFVFEFDTLDNANIQ